MYRGYILTNYPVHRTPERFVEAKAGLIKMRDLMDTFTSGMRKAQQELFDEMFDSFFNNDDFFKPIDVVEELANRDKQIEELKGKLTAMEAEVKQLKGDAAPVEPAPEQKEAPAGC